MALGHSDLGPTLLGSVTYRLVSGLGQAVSSGLSSIKWVIIIPRHRQSL